MTKHSPGPWTHGIARISLSTGDIHEWGVFGGGEEIALVHRPGNARLIAAAPEMLALLRKIDGIWQGDDLPNGLGSELTALLERIK